jgi:predicted nucleic acid-binding protein
VGSTVVLDTGLLVEFLMGTKTGTILDTMVFRNPYITSILLNPLALVEIYYVIRRKSTTERARAEVSKVRKLVRVVPLEDYLETVGELKAATSIALADVASIALAEHQDVKVLFKHEEEIDEKLKQHGSEAFIRRIVFIEDFPSFKAIKAKLDGN